MTLLLVGVLVGVAALVALLADGGCDNDCPYCRCVERRKRLGIEP